jgi:hypothetical protein
MAAAYCLLQGKKGNNEAQNGTYCSNKDNDRIRQSHIRLLSIYGRNFPYINVQNL